MKQILGNSGFWLLLVASILMGGCATENTNNLVASEMNNPHWIFLGTKGDPLYTWMNNRSAIRDTLAVGLGGGVNIQDEGVNYDEIAAKCIVASSQVKSYESRFFLKDFTSDKVKDKDYVFIEWYIEHEKPGKYEVEQTAWAENVADRWITLGEKHYFLVGGWFEDPDTDWRSETNKILTLEKYIDIIQNNIIDSAGKYRKEEMEFIVLRYTTKDLKAFGMDTGHLRNINCQTEIWIDENSMIIAASVKIHGINNNQKTDMEYRQLFAGYNRKFDIKKPEDVIRLKER